MDDIKKLSEIYKEIRNNCLYEDIANETKRNFSKDENLPYFAIFNGEPLFDSVKNKVQKILANKEEDMRFLYFKSSTETTTHKDFYINIIDQIISSSTTFTTITNNRIGDGILFNNPELINQINLLLKTNGNIKIAILNKFRAETPKDFLNMIIGRHLDKIGNQVKIYDLSEKKAFINNIRIIITDLCIKITGDEETIFIFNPKGNQNAISKKYFEEIKELVEQIFEKDSFYIIKTEDLEKEIQTPTEQIVDAIDGLKKEIVELPEKIAFELAKILNKK